MTRTISARLRTDLLVLVAFCGFLFCYGLGSFGLVGADEPRYAQVAREMLERSDWITPTLLGKPWLEKPVLYYWQAIAAFRLTGVSDQAARLPAAFDAALLIAIIYLFLRRFRPGSELDGALITASCVGMIAFAHAAATDMPLAATFGVALIGWYAWYESRRRFYLAGCYIFLALGTLAKGPVAPALAAVVIGLFVAAKRDWRALVDTLWIPGIVLYLAVMLPWYIAVQLRNPEFFRVFILEHNLARFSQDLYHHRQPFWFYLPVFLIAMMPWTVIFIVALVDRVRLVWPAISGRVSSPGGPASSSVPASTGEDTTLSSAPDESWTLFLLIWMFVPILFFSASQSKLPGYILPAVPAGALLVAGYLAGSRRKVSSGNGARFSPLIAVVHGILCGFLVFAALCAAPIAISHHLQWTKATYVNVAIAILCALIVAATLLSGAGFRLISRSTTVVVAVSVFLAIRFAAPAIDATQSVRPVAENIRAFSHEDVPLAIFGVSRQQEYGLEFYLNRPAEKYDDGNVPAAAHVLVAAKNSQAQVAELASGRRVSYLAGVPAQKVDLYWVGK